MIIPFWGPRICREIPPPRVHLGGGDRVRHRALRIRVRPADIRACPLRISESRIL